MEFYFGNIALLVGVVFFTMGGIMQKWPPKNINALYGYRTGSSMKSKERWDFAQGYSANIMIKGGIALTIIGLIMALFKIGIEVITAVGMVAMFVCIGYLLFSTETALKRKFKD
ncbi:MAG: SdpI family protein [Bacteroidia bacterium]